MKNGFTKSTSKSASKVVVSEKRNKVKDKDVPLLNYGLCHEDVWASGGMFTCILTLEEIYFKTTLPRTVEWLYNLHLTIKVTQKN